MKKRLGIFGGSFDPVHNMHLELATAAANQLNLDQVRWIVTGKPVHKKTFVSAKHRLKMVSLALKDLSDSRMVIDPKEVLASSKGTTPSYKTLESLKKEEPDKEFLWIMGEDQLVNFTEWQNWEWLIENMHILVCSRPNFLESKEYFYSDKQKMFFSRNKKKIIWIDVHPDSCSSTKIRESVYKGFSIKDFTSSSVEKYISNNKLYESRKGDKNFKS